MVSMVQRYRSFDPFDLARNSVVAPTRAPADVGADAGMGQGAGQAWPPIARPATRTAANDPVRPARTATSHGELSVLETRHPQMARAIELLWGHEEMNLYFDKLWLADGRQEPIDPETMSELMLLAQIHTLLVPGRPQRTMASIYGSEYGRRDVPQRRRDIWDDTPPRR